jgi:hypothetical protein
VKGLSLWVDGQPVEVKPETEVELTRGVHTLTFKLDVAARGGAGLRVEVRDIQGSAGHAQPLGGR